MELRHLRYFLALAENLNFTKAAQSVHVTQSTLSHQIKQLEERIGHRLFDRSGTAVTLTSAGMMLLPNAVRALGEINEAIRKLNGESSGGMTGRLRILIGSYAFARSLFPLCVRAFNAELPSITLLAEETLASSFRRELETGSFDIAIADRDAANPGYEFEPVFDEELCLLVSRAHAFAKRRSVRMIELHCQPLIVPAPSHPIRMVMDRCLRAVQAEPTILVEMNTLSTLFDLPKYVDAAAVTVASAIADPELVHVPLEDPVPYRTIGFLWNDTDKAVTAVSRRFADTVLNVVRQEHASQRMPGYVRAAPPSL